jgi:hypothetical protein
VSGESGGISADPLCPLGISVVGGRRLQGIGFFVHDIWRKKINQGLAGLLLTRFSHLSPFSSWYGEHVGIFGVSEWHTSPPAAWRQAPKSSSLVFCRTSFGRVVDLSHPLSPHTSLLGLTLSSEATAILIHAMRRTWR